MNPADSVLFIITMSPAFKATVLFPLLSFILHSTHSSSISLSLASFSSALQHLEFMVEAVHSAEIELPGLLVLVVQAVYGTETQRSGAVSLGGERG